MPSLAFFPRSLFGFSASVGYTVSSMSATASIGVMLEREENRAFSLGDVKPGWQSRYQSSPLRCGAPNRLTCAAEYLKTSEESSIYDYKYVGMEWSLSTSLATSSRWMYLLRIEVFVKRFERQEKKEEKK